MTAKRLLDLRDKGVKQVIKEHKLGSLPIIGRGVYSVVYDAGDSVIKLTCDPTAYEFAQFYCCQSSHFPNINNAFGYVGVQVKGDRDLFIIKTEKLIKLRHGSKNKKLAVLLCKLSSSIMSKRTPAVFGLAHRGKVEPSVIVPETLFHLADVKNELITPDIKNALDVLANFCMNYDGIGLDFHTGNFMERESDGMLVFSDPINDVNQSVSHF